jgi:hypothetical protein
MDANALLVAIEDHALVTGLFETVNGHEPKNPPSNGITLAIWLKDIMPVPASSGLDIVTIRVSWFVRLYSNVLQEPQDDIDTNLLNALSMLFTQYCGAFTLGGLVRNVDIFGESGTALSALSGYVTMSGSVYRVMTITLPVIINDEWPEVE